MKVCRHCKKEFNPEDSKCNYFCGKRCCNESYTLTNDKYLYPECEECFIGRVTNKSNLSQVTINVNDKSLSMNAFLVIEHPQLKTEILCQVADLHYNRGGALIAILNILEGIPNPFPPNHIATEAVNGTVARVLNLKECDGYIHIGKLLGHDIGVYLNPDSLILKHISILGMTGSGKTYTVGVLIEELIKREITAVVVDPHGDYVYMEKHYPDKIIVIKPTDDECRSVETIHHDNKITIINMRDWEDTRQPRAVYDIGWTLFRAVKFGEIKPFLFAVDECHRFAPQKERVKSSKIIATIAGEGRKFGMGLCAITQRPARINKDVISQCNTHIILKVTNPNDVRAIMTSIEGIRKEDKAKLQLLESGSGQALIIGSNIRMPQYVQIKKKECGEKEKKTVMG